MEILAIRSMVQVIPLAVTTRAALLSSSCRKRCVGQNATRLGADLRSRRHTRLHRTTLPAWQSGERLVR